ncbi:MAG TPA: UrcA family protein [Rhizomicrobium sp.]|jgi:UrcA family protein
MMRSVLIASTVGLLLAGTSAFAQGYDGPNYGDTENVIVTAPRIHVQRPAPGMVATRISMSIPVRYDDLNLRSWRGARQLRVRVRETAFDVCGRLKAEYPGTLDDADTCFREAARVAMLHADRAIARARSAHRYYAAYYR